jgi:hypothetical protein
MPSFQGEVKPSAPCHRFSACKETPAIYVEVGIIGKIDRPFLTQFCPSLTEVPHVTWRGAPLEMTGGTKGGAQRASSLRPRCVGEVDPKTATHIYHPHHQWDFFLSSQHIGWQILLYLLHYILLIRHFHESWHKKIKANFTPQHTMNTQRGGRDVTLPFDTGVRKRWVVKPMPWSLYSQ